MTCIVATEPGDPAGLSAQEAAAEIRAGRLTAERLVQACLARIAEHEPAIQAWAFLDPEHALRQARQADRAMIEGKPLGGLHGVPIGVKDIFDTADMPTENGTPLHAGRRPAADATVLGLLRSAGAVVLGKTVTTELAVYTPGKTRNPWDPTRTPGGSSSGSAAAVATRMVPAALATQTNGSVIRPAAYCGVVGYKPTFGLVSRHGVLAQSARLDQVGVIARSLGDVALVAEAIMAFDPLDRGMAPRAHPRLRDGLEQQPPAPPRLAFVRTPYWDQADADTRERFEQLAGGLAEEVKLSVAFEDAAQIHKTILEADLAVSFAEEYMRGAHRLSAMLRSMIERGQRSLTVDYLRAAASIQTLAQLLDDVLAKFDAILTPATTGEAPPGLRSTGSPIFCTIWTLCGAPAVTLPILTGANGLPLGVQLVGRRLEDGRLLRTARWVWEKTAVSR